MTNDMRNLLAVAISKKLTTTPLDPGEYHLTGLVTLEVDVHVKKGEPTFYRPTTSLPLKAVLAVALVKAGVAADDIARVVSEAAREALGNGRAVVEALEKTEAGLAAVETMLDRLPPQRREGSTRIDGSVEIVETVERKAPSLRSA